jgi:hypothetical protein
MTAEVDPLGVVGGEVVGQHLGRRSSPKVRTRSQPLPPPTTPSTGSSPRTVPGLGVDEAVDDLVHGAVPPTATT